MENLPQIDLSQIDAKTVIVILVLFLTGVVELVKRINEALDPNKEDRNWGAVRTIVGAALAGAIALPLFGNFFVGLNVTQLAVVGMVLGFNASGAITMLSYLGRKASSPVEVVMPSAAVPVIDQQLETEELPPAK